MRGRATIGVEHDPIYDHEGGGDALCDDAHGSSVARSTPTRPAWAEDEHLPRVIDGSDDTVPCRGAVGVVHRSMGPADQL